MPVCGYVYMYAGADKAQKKISDPLEQELQAVMCLLMWVLGTELRSSAEAVCALDFYVISVISIKSP